MFNLALVDQNTLLGLSLLERGAEIVDGNLNEKATAFLLSQAADNFCGVLCAIGYQNMKSIAPDLMEHVNAYARTEIEYYDSI